MTRLHRRLLPWVLLATALASCATSEPRPGASPSPTPGVTASASPEDSSRLANPFPLATTTCKQWNDEMSDIQKSDLARTFFASLSEQDLRDFKGGYEGTEPPPPRATATGEALFAEFQKFIEQVCSQNPSANLMEAVLGTARTEH